MDVSIVILNYKQKGLVRQCVKGIVAAKPELEYEIIVVDNNSGDGVLNDVKKLFDPQASDEEATLFKSRHSDFPPLVCIASDENRGMGAGNNLGMKRAKGEFVFVINPDVAITKGSLEHLVQYMRTHSDIGVLGPKLINPDGTIQDSCRRFPKFLTPLYRRTFLGKFSFAKKALDDYLMMDWDHRQIRDVDWLFGAALLMPRTALEEVGMFDEDFFLYFEDLDLCRRFWEQSYRVVYYPEVELVHYHQRESANGGSLKALFNRATRAHIASWLQYSQKYRGKELPRHDG